MSCQLSGRLAPVRFALVWFAPSRFALRSYSQIRSTPYWIASLRYAFVRSAKARLAHLRSAPVRVVPLRSTYIMFAPYRFAPVRSASVRSAFLRSAPLRSALLRSARVRSAPYRIAPGPIVYPLTVKSLRSSTGASVTTGASDEQPAANNIKLITTKEMIRLIKETLTNGRDVSRRPCHYMSREESESELWSVPVSLRVGRWVLKPKPRGRH